MNPKILMIAYTYYLTDARVIKAAEAVVKIGYQVDFIALHKKDELTQEEINGVHVIRLNQSRYRGSSNVRYLMAYLHFFVRCFFNVTFLYIKNRYKIVHVNNLPDFLVFSAVIPKIFGAKIILDIHDPMPAMLQTKFGLNSKSIRYKLLLYQEKLSSIFADRVITVHEPLKQDILIRDGIPAEKINVVTNFADENVFKLTPSYSVDNPLKLIFHGTITQRTGLDEVLNALASVKHKGFFYFKILGEGDFSETLQRQILKLGLDNVVDFENRFRPYEELPELVRTYHIGLATYQLSSATEYMLPVKMLEYIALGIPFITVRNTAIKYYLRDDECLYYEPDNWRSLTAILDQISINTHLLLSQREKILSIRERFLWTNEQRKYIRLLNELIN